jgi:transposase
LSRHRHGVLRHVDASHLKVHQDAHGGVGGKESQAIGYTRGGSNSKLHAVVDGKGRLVRATLTAGQVNDAKIGPEIIAGLKGVRIVADKGYDSERMRQSARDSGSHSCIPKRNGSKESAPFHKGYYRKRHQVENFFQRIKRNRRIATRYDKLSEVYMNFILLAASIDWINSIWGFQTRPSVGLQRATQLLASGRSRKSKPAQAESQTPHDIAGELAAALVSIPPITDAERREMRAASRPGRSYLLDDEGHITAGDFSDVVPPASQAVADPPEPLVMFPEPITAIWRNKDFDQPVTLTGRMSEPGLPDHYLTAGKNGIPVSEVFFEN